MKLVYKSIFLSLATLVTWLPATAKNTIEKNKVVKREFKDVSNATSIRLVNKFGDIDISTWDENRVSIEVTISVEHSNETKAQKALDAVTIGFKSSDNLIEAITSIEGLKESKTVNYEDGRYIPKGGATKTQIDYVVKMPSHNRLNASNKFGNIYVNKLDGEANIDVRYGFFKADELNNAHNRIKLVFARESSFGNVNKAKVDAKYSSFTVIRARTLDVSSRFSNFDIEKVDTLDLNTQYDRIKVNQADVVYADSRFTTLELMRVKHKVDIDNAYGYLRIGGIENGFDRLRVHNEFAKVKIEVASNLGFDFEGTSHFADINYPRRWELNTDIQQRSGTYSGQVRGGGGKMEITTRYGNVSLVTR